MTTDLYARMLAGDPDLAAIDARVSALLDEVRLLAAVAPVRAHRLLVDHLHERTWIVRQVAALAVLRLALAQADLEDEAAEDDGGTDESHRAEWAHADATGGGF